MSYRRVIPRDLFNEAKLLKCLGKITLLIHDKMIQGLNAYHENQREGFKIFQNPSDGSIQVVNLNFFDNNGTPVFFLTPLNDRGPWPLVMEYKGETYFPFNDNGDYQLWSKLFL